MRERAETDKQAETQTARITDLRDRQTDRQTGRQAGRQAGRQTGRDIEEINKNIDADRGE